MNKVRKRLYDHEATALGLSLNKKLEGRKQTFYLISVEQWEQVLALRNEGIEISCNEHKIDITTVKHLWKKNKESSVFVKNPLYQDPEFTIESLNIDEVVQKYIQPIEITPLKIQTDFLFDRLVITDVHIGMTTNENGFSLYGGKWDEEEIKLTLETVIAHTLANKKSNILIIDELGDFLDGWNAQTVRQGHHLQQNMDNEKAFDVGLYFKIRLIDALAKNYQKIICHNICNDNHAGSFGYVVNSAFKQIAETRYKNVSVNNVRTFISHYYFKDYCFIITHGKDGKNLKFGFKPKLDPKQIEVISNYIKHHNINSKHIEFSKGDSHQNIFDESTADNFFYYNYGALSPSSEWVQTNFKKGKRSFQFFNFKDNGQKVHNPYTFEWNINRVEIFNDYSL